MILAAIVSIGTIWAITKLGIGFGLAPAFSFVLAVAGVLGTVAVRLRLGN